MPKTHLRPIFWLVLLSFGALGFIVTSKAVFDHRLDKEYNKYQHVFQRSATKKELVGSNGASLSVCDVWVNPQNFDFDSNKISELSALIKRDEVRMIENIRAKAEEGKVFAFLKVAVETDQAKEVKKLGIAGVRCSVPDK